MSNQIDYIEHKTHFTPPDERITHLFIDSEERAGFTNHVVKYFYKPHPTQQTEQIIILSISPMIAYKGGWMFGYGLYSLMAVDFNEERIIYNEIKDFVSKLTFDDLVKIYKEAEVYVKK